MNQDNRKNAHQEIDHIFKELLPAHGMAERPAQVDLSHRMLDAMLDGSIALCDAGTGIGKTYAYLVAGTVFLRCRAAAGLPFHPLLISTSSIALQNAVLNEYLPFLSAVLMAGQLMDHPLRAVVRKGKSHYVCDERLRRRLGAVDLGRKSPRAREALLSLRDHLDLDMAEHLSGYDRERVHVPQVCDCGQETEVSGASLVQGCTLSCGCLKRENQKKITERLHRGYGTCVEFLERRKYRSDNTSGHCGVSQLKNGRYRSYIGFRGKRYYLGTFDTYDEAVQARQEAEQTVYDSFLETYYEWKKKADADRKWKETHPLIFEVERKDGNLVVRKDTGRKKQPE